DARVDAPPDPLGVALRRRGDDEPLGAGRQEVLRSGGDLDLGVRADPAQVPGDLGGRLPARVREDERLEGGQADERLGVEGADPSEARRVRSASGDRSFTWEWACCGSLFPTAVKTVNTLSGHMHV